MAHRVSRLVLLLGLGGLFMSSSAVPLHHPPSIHQVVQQIDSKQGPWIILSAKTRIHFLAESQQAASCNGDLLYDRLKEKLLLKCYNESRDLLFAYKTHDQLFELYVPAQNTVFHGDIFDLEHSREIESHLKPLQIYRALKIGAIPKDRAELENWDEKTVSLKIFGRRDEESYLARRLVSTHEGKVVLEIFYDLNEAPRMKVHRADYQSVPREGFKHAPSSAFPHQIKIETVDPAADTPVPSETVFEFQAVRFLSWTPPGQWDFRAPSYAEKILVAEKTAEQPDAAPSGSVD